MGFVSWYLRRGRIDRRVFWLHYVVPVLVLSGLALAADLAFGSTNVLDVAAGRATELEQGPFTTVVGLAVVCPQLSAQATRLHDQGRSAWWLLLNVVPLFGQLALLGLCGFVPGQPVANRYGPPAGPGPVPPRVDGPTTPWVPGPADRAPDYPPSDWR